MNTIDINCDLGEGMGNENELIEYINSLNIACGFHAGNKKLLRKIMKLGQEFNKHIGLHPGFKDKKNFGRLEIKMDEKSIYNLIKEQIELGAEIAYDTGIKLHHVKLHGALYNMVCQDKSLSTIFAQVVRTHFPFLIIYGAAQSALEDVCNEHKIEFWAEAFVDRTYTSDGNLTSRNLPNAYNQTISKVLKQTEDIIKEERVQTIDGTYIKLKAKTLCLHGDGAKAVAIAKKLHNFLKNEMK